MPPSLGASEPISHTADSNRLEHGCRMICVDIACFFALELEDGHVPMASTAHTWRLQCSTFLGLPWFSG